MSVAQAYIKVTNHISRLAEKYLTSIKDLSLYLSTAAPDGFAIAGGALLSGQKINDIDIFPLRTKGKSTRSLPDGWELVCQTKNAETLTNGKLMVQICNYVKQSLEELIESFDFSHIQVGVECKNTLTQFRVDRIHFTPAFIEAQVIRDSDFMGSDYPLSSLIRLMKYRERGAISRGKSMVACLEILAALVKRGFSSYDDFKDQLDAIDLGLVPAQYPDIEMDSVKDLFDILHKYPVARKEPIHD